MNRHFKLYFMYHLFLHYGSESKSTCCLFQLSYCLLSGFLGIIWDKQCAIELLTEQGAGITKKGHSSMLVRELQRYFQEKKEKKECELIVI